MPAELASALTDTPVRPVGAVAAICAARNALSAQACSTAEILAAASPIAASRVARW